MKGLIIPIVVVIGTIGLTYYFIGVKTAEPLLLVVPRSPAATSVESDPVEVFKRAFWRRPTPVDKILHAERREWADASGLRKWQWFIKVEPSPELVRYLRDDNSFGLTTMSSVPKFQDAPAWFKLPPTGAEIFQAPRGDMYLIFCDRENVLYAAASGGGFHPGAPEPTKVPLPAHAPAGRLPTTPPPDSPGR